MKNPIRNTDTIVNTTLSIAIILWLVLLFSTVAYGKTTVIFENDIKTTLQNCYTKIISRDVVVGRVDHSVTMDAIATSKKRLQLEIEKLDAEMMKLKMSHGSPIIHKMDDVEQVCNTIDVCKRKRASSGECMGEPKQNWTPALPNTWSNG